MAFTLTPSVPPNIPDDKIYSINDFNDYFYQLQDIISAHDDSLANLVSESAGYFPFYNDPVDTIDEVLPAGIYYMSPSVQGTFPEGATKNGSFLIATGTLQFLFDSTGIYFRDYNEAQWVKTSGASVIDSLESDSTIDSLSAKQGKVLNEKKLDVFTHKAGDVAADIDNIELGVHSFIDAEVSGTFPDFADISSGSNKFILESLGVTDEIVVQRLTDSTSSTIGFRIGIIVSGMGEELVWFDWTQFATVETVESAIENLVIDCGTF